VKRLSASIIVALSLCAPAAAQWPAAPQWPSAPQWFGGTQSENSPVVAARQSSIVRIIAPGADSVSYGSGSLVLKTQKHGLVVTNWHVVNEATGQITVAFPDGFTSAGTIVKVDRDWDLAAIAIWRPNAEPVPLATQAPQPGETLTIAGYGPGNFRAVSGKCTQYVAPGTTFPYEMVELATTARQGDSGGPILNSRGELAGVLFGEGGGRTAGSYCGRVQWFLSGLAPPDAAGGSGAMIAAAPQGAGNPRAAGPPVNPYAAPAQRGARVGALASLGTAPPAMPTNTAPMPPAALAPTPPRPQAASSTLASTEVVRDDVVWDNDGWQSAAPPGLADPERDLPLPRSRPANSEGEMAAVPRVRGIPDAAAFGPAAVAQPPAERQTALEEPSDEPTSREICWSDIAGHTLGEQVKTVLATIGGLAVMMQAIGWFSSGPKPTKKKREAEDDEEEDDD